MNRDELALRDRIIIGLNLTYGQLLETKQKEDSFFVFSSNGKVTKKKASELEKIKTNPVFTWQD